MRILGLLFCCLALVAAILMESGLHSFVHLPSVTVVFVVGFGTVIFAHGMDGFSSLLKATFLDVSNEGARLAKESAHTAGRAFIGAGWLGTVIGMTQILQDLDDPRTIGPSLAVAFLTVLYGYACAVILWMPTERRMETRTM